MAMLSVSSALQPRTSILPEGGRDFLRRRMMEIVGVATAGFGLALMMALFTYSPGDPSLNHATARAPNNLLGLPGAYISDLLLQTFGLAIILAPVAFITWGVRMVRTHHLGFFGLRLSLLLLALLMMSVACVGLGDVGGAATHAGPGGLVGLALVGRFRELVLTHSSGGALTFIEPVAAALAFIAMAPALGMNRTDLPLIFRILRAPFLWVVWGMRAAVGLWRGKPQPLDEESEPPAPHIGYAEIPGEIDASQYDPARFENRYEQIPEEGAGLPARDSLMVDAPYAPMRWSRMPAARRRAGGFRRQGRDHPRPPRPGRHALRTRAGARHQVEPRHRLADDIARSMSAISARVAVVPGRNAIGIELPNASARPSICARCWPPRFREIEGQAADLALGKTIGGEPVIADLAKMPHLLSPAPPARASRSASTP
jgi:S-DNA-T family DNA segregation ATPase FtsK/SpoIIIE